MDTRLTPASEVARVDPKFATCALPAMHRDIEKAIGVWSHQRRTWNALVGLAITALATAEALRVLALDRTRLGC